MYVAYAMLHCFRWAEIIVINNNGDRDYVINNDLLAGAGDPWL